ncbi:MAG: DUF3857 domain-containing protein [Planctomycetes bacterium]|nr:DUF3857 domain-containing protein [Planctomycetota bacterium]
MRARVLVLLCSLHVLGAVFRPARAADPDDPSILCERAALRALARGADREAAATLRDGIARLAQATPVDATGIEVLLRRHRGIAADLGLEEDRLALAKLLEPVRDLDPNLAALAMGNGAGAAWRLGLVEDAWRRWKAMGFVLSWWICGSFDNERGRGFGEPFGPERDPRLAARYPGKEREVGWRALPAPPPAGYVDLDAMLRPNDEVLAYAMAYLESPREIDAALRVASDDGIRIWVNGAEVLARNVERTIGFDQDVVAVRLAKGWNRILVKVTEAKDAWGFRIRVTSVDGSPLSTPLRALAPGEPEPETILPVPPSAAAVRRGAIDSLRDLVRRDPEALWPHLRLAYVIQDIGAHDRSEHPDEDEARRAVELAPEDPDARSLLADTLARSTAVAAEREENSRRRALEEAFARDGSRARDALALARLAWDLHRNAVRAREWLARARERGVPSFVEPIALEADIRAAEALAHERDLLLAREVFSRDDARGIPWVERERAAWLERRGALEEAAAVLRARLRQDRTDTGARRALVSILVRCGDDAAALRVLESWSATYPFSPEPMALAARILWGRDRGAEAATSFGRAVAIAPEDADLREEMGRVLWELGRDDEAIEAWEQALALEPNRPELRRYVDLVRRKERSLRDLYGEDLAGAIGEALREGDEPEGAAYRIILDKTVVRVNADGTTREFRQLAAKILNDQGVRAFDRYGIGYVPAEQAPEFLEARVFRPDGRIERARLPSSPRGGGTAERTFAVDLPSISPGDAVEVQVHVQDTKPSFFGDYFGRRVPFGTAQPADRVEFILLAPASRSFSFRWRNGEIPCRRRSSGDDTEYAWAREAVPRLELEPAMPPLLELVPTLEISTFADWGAFARWYWNLIRREFRATPAIRQKALALAEGRTDRREKIRAVYEFVTREIRYEAWEIGVHGYQPYSAEAIFERGFGDCKDKALLMCVLLGELKIPAHLVLIHAMTRRFDEDLTLPMIGHFNHAIAYVPPEGDGEGIFLDGTAQKTSMEELPSADRGAQVLVLDGERGELRRIPWNAPEENGARERVRIALSGDGSAILRVALEARGDFAVRLRRFFEIPGRRRESLAQIYGRRHAGAQILSEDFSDLDDLTRPVRMEVEVSVPRFVEEGTGGRWPPLPDDFFGLLDALSGLVGRETRVHDAIIGAPFEVSVETVYEIPDGWTVRSLPHEARGVADEAEFIARFEAKGLEIRADRILRLRAPRIESERYPAFRKVIVAIEQSKQEKILIEEDRTEGNGEAKP